MSYTPGDYIDLSHINSSHQTEQLKKKSATETLYQIGTSFKFFLKDGQYKAARRIPVAFA